MPKKLWIQNYTPPAAGPTTPTTRGSWTITGQAAIYRALIGSGFAKAGGSNSAAPKNNASASYGAIFGKFVSYDTILSAGNLAGTLTYALGGFESNALLNATFRIYGYVTVGDTDVMRGSPFCNNVNLGTEMPISAGVRAGSVSITSTAVQPGDKIVIEIGHGSTTAPVTTTYTATFYYGGSGPDLTTGSASANITSAVAADRHAPFFEFSDTNNVFVAPVQQPATYYVAANGSDSNNGTASGTPWQTWAKVVAKTFVPGDVVLFRGGDTFSASATVDIPVSESNGANQATPIRFGSYGTGRATISGTTYLLWTRTGGMILENLNWTQTGTQQFATVYLYKDGAGTDQYIRVNNCTFTGGAQNLSFVSANAGKLNDIQITNCEFVNALSTGLSIASPTFDPVTPDYAWTNVLIENCKASGAVGTVTNGTGCGMQIAGINGGTVRGCTTYNNGSGSAGPRGGSGIFTFNCNLITVESNVSYGNMTTTRDGNGISIDQYTRNSICQYNLCYSNFGPGVLVNNITSTNYGNGNVIRYNMCKGNGINAGAYGQIEVSGPVGATDIYNNTLVALESGTFSPPSITVETGCLGVTVRNNIFSQRAGGAVIDSPALATSAILFQGNAYFATDDFMIKWGGVNYTNVEAWKAAAAGQETLSGNPTQYQGRLYLVDADSIPTVTDAANILTSTGMQLQNISPVRDKGLNLASLFGTAIGARDFYGTAPSTPFAIGAHENQTASNTNGLGNFFLVM